MIVWVLFFRNFCRIVILDHVGVTNVEDHDRGRKTVYFFYDGQEQTAFLSNDTV